MVQNLTLWPQQDGSFGWSGRGRRERRKMLYVPEGQITQKPVQSLLQKYSAFVLTQIIGITPPVSPN